MIVEFLHSLEGLNGKQLLKTMQSLLSKGVAAGQKGIEQIKAKVRVSRNEKALLEKENRKLREENAKLKNRSWQFGGQVETLTGQCSKQKTAIDALKQEPEKSLQCCEECHIELKDMVTQYDTQEIQIQALNNLVAELKKVKGELEDTLDKNEAFCHQWGGTFGLRLSSSARTLWS
jgi:chromosome segregation ATPase